MSRTKTPSSATWSHGLSARSRPTVEVRSRPAAPAPQKLPAPWVGSSRTSGGSAASSRSEWNWERVRPSVAAGPRRSVRPARPGQQAAPGRHGDRPVVGRVGRADVPGQVLRRVARGRARPQVDVADDQHVAVVDRAVREVVPAAGRCEDLAAVGGAQLEGAGQVVVVDVGLDDVGDPPAARRGRRFDVPRIARRVDHDRVAVGRRDEVGRVAQAADLEGGDVHQPVRPITGRHRRRSVR